MNKFLPIILVTIIVVGGGAFYGGVKYAESNSSTGSGQGNPRGQFSRADFQNLSPEERRERLQELGANAGGSRGGLGGGQRGGAGGFITGGIISKDDRSVTIKLQDSGSKIVFLSDSTEITKFAEGTLTDLEVGKNISVNGAANPDGSLTAQTIQLRPRND